MLIDRSRTLPVLLIVTFRPEFQPRWPELPHVTAMSLGRLGHDEGAAIIDRVAGGRTLPSQVKDQILAKTEGVPLFVEELTKTVLESDLRQDGDPDQRSGTLPSLVIPSTLQDSLMARLDRLSSVKNVAQVGACIGRVFHHRLLAAIIGSDAALLKSTFSNSKNLDFSFEATMFRRQAIPLSMHLYRTRPIRVCSRVGDSKSTRLLQLRWRRSSRTLPRLSPRRSHITAWRAAWHIGQEAIG